MRIHNISHRFDSLLKLEYEQRVNFVTEYGVPTSHLLSEHFRTFPVTYGFQKNSIFTSKFSEVIRFVLNQFTEYHDVLTLLPTCRVLNEAGLVVYWKNNEMDKVSHLKSMWNITFSHEVFSYQGKQTWSRRFQYPKGHTLQTVSLAWTFSDSA